MFGVKGAATSEFAPFVWKPFVSRGVVAELVKFWLCATCREATDGLDPEKSGFGGGGGGGGGGLRACAGVGLDATEPVSFFVR